MHNTNSNNLPHSKGQCAACGSSLEGGVCPTCGWVQILFPKDVPSEIEEFNAKREEMAKRLHHEANAEKNKCESLRQDLGRAKEEIRTTQSECESLKRKNQEADRNLGSMKQEMQRSAADVQRLNSQNKTLKEVLARVESDLSALKRNPPVADGAQIRIVNNHGKYVLYDASGTVHRDNGMAIEKNGIELYDGCAFDIGELSFRVSAPEFDLSNLKLD